MVIKFSTSTYEKCKKDFIAFKNANREAERDEKHFDWRYLDRPCELKPIIVWAENSDGRKIGALSIVPHHYSIDNKVYPLGILGDISVAKEYRGQGIAKKMFNYLSGLDEIKKLKACIVLPNEDAARPLEKTGWQTVSRLERYIKVLDVKKRLKGKVFLEALSPFINSLLKLLSYETFLKEAPGFKGEVIDAFDDRFDELWNSLNKNGMIIGLRNKEYLRWRYQLHPTVKYHIFTFCAHEKLCGYIIFHFDRDTCYIDDILSFKEKEYPTYLLYYFINYLKKNISPSAIAMRFNESGLSEQLPLTRFGFKRRSDFLRLMVYLDGSESEERFFLKGSKWFVTAGDKDV